MLAEQSAAEQAAATVVDAGVIHSDSDHAGENAARERAPRPALEDNARFALSLLSIAHCIARGDVAARSSLERGYTAARLQYLAARKLYGLARMGAPAETGSALFSLYQKVWRAQRTALLGLIDLLSSRGIDVMIIKGAETTERYFASQPVCLRGDIDLIVRPGQLDQVKAALREFGLVQADYDIENYRLVPLSDEQLDRTQRGRYNLRSFAKLIELPVSPAEIAIGRQWLTPVSIRADGATLVLGVDVSVGLDQEIGADEMFSRSRASVFAGARAFSAEDHIWYTASLFYLQTYFNKQRHKLTQLADLIALIGNNAATIDWSHLIGLGHRYAALPSLYYPIAYVDRLIGTCVPAEVIAALSPVHGARSRDYGWQLAKLFGVVDAFPSDLLP